MREYREPLGPCAALISAGKATLVELDTVLSLEDAYYLMDILRIDAVNRRIADDHARRQQER